MWVRIMIGFTMWVANYDRLPTRSRLAAWGLPVSPLCPFCNQHDKTRDHLFISCTYSQDVWRGVLVRCQPNTSAITSWSELLFWIKNQSFSRRLTLLRKLAAQSVIYHIWKQRNNLVHNQTSIPASTVFRAIDKEVENIISARRLRKRFSSLMKLWLR